MFNKKRLFGLPLAMSLLATGVLLLASCNQPQQVVNKTMAAGSPSADLDQCANDPSPSPSTDGCNTDASSWVNGNVGSSKAVYFEGDSLPYRMRFDNLSLASHTVTIQWDTTKSGTHAFDYLTTYNQSVANAVPCLGVSLDCSSPTTFAIPVDPQVSGAGVTPIAGNFTMWGGTITAVSAYSYPDGAGFAGDKSAQITITFTPTAVNPVLAWSAHISTRKDWGNNNAAVAISGSPFHTRLIDLDGSGGNQDRSMSADAVVFPGSLTIIKQATPEGSTSFSFSASPSPLSNFSLVDDGTAANTKVFSNITSFTTYAVAENVPANWSLSGIGCSVTSPNGGSTANSLPSVSINLKEGENWTCTFTNAQQVGSLVIAKALTGGSFAGSFSIHYDCGLGVSGDVSVNTGSSQTVSNIPAGSACTISEPTLPTAPTGYSWGTPSISTPNPVTVQANSSVTVTVTNSLSRDKGYLKISKAFDPQTSGFNGTFAVVYNCGSGDQTVNLAAGGSTTVGPFDSGTSCTVSEPTLPGAPSGWSFGTPSISGSPATVTKGDQASAVAVTVTNTISRDTGSLKITKATTNPDGASLPAAFTGTYDCGNGNTGNFSVASGGSQTVSGIPTGSTCTVTEVTPAPIAGYTWATPTYNPASVSIGTKNQTFEITITNSISRDRGSLTVVKKVINDNGGSKTVSDFGLTSSAGSLSFSSSSSGTTTTYTSQKITVVTGSYSLKENDVYGYTEGTWSCTNASTITPTFNSGSVAVEKDKDVVCTISNDDQPGTIIVKKNTLPLNTGSFGFTTSGSGYSSFSLGGGGQNSQTLNAGSYTVKEGTQLGWTLTGIGGSTDPNTPYNCVVSGSGGSSGSGDLNTQTATISLKNGDTVTCTFENTGNGATRTQGFWATHPQLAQIAWFGGTAYGHTFPGVASVLGDTTLCGRSLDLSALMGGFWSSISQTTSGAKRSSLDQARMQLLQQLLAAELNASAFGSLPSGGAATINAWEAAYCGTNQNAIKSAQQGAASFNTKGDSATFTPGTSADSKGARFIANLAFWNTLP